ncbi:MAG TPA: DUF3472 domain-containing protein [Isosphaeraceae bacterium]|nr:DUF3472 domain-containing protein [Isosphaeraceae bacterium]
MNIQKSRPASLGCHGSSSTSASSNVVPAILRVAILLGLFVSPALGQAPRACRSVHLHYPAPEAVAFYNEVSVDVSVPGTYFCVCGFNKGYYGIQELPNGKKLLIFSVWDPGQQDDPNAVEEDRRVKLLYHDPAVRIGRFGNEGTGGQSFFDYDWKVGEIYRFLVTAKPDGDRTAYTAWFFVPEDRAWKRLATFSTLASGTLLKGDYSFVEDFLRNGRSARQPRQAHYGPGWVQTKDGEWQPLNTAIFTADNTPTLNIDAFAHGPRFVLATGGDTPNAHTKLNDRMKREENADIKPPADLP